MGKKLKGGRRQILQLEEKKPPKTASKSKMKSLIHYSDSDDDSKKSNDSEPSSTAQIQKDATPLDSEIADFFKEIDALSVPEELIEQSSSSPAQEESVKPVPVETTSTELQQDSPDLPQSEADSHNKKQNKEVQCAWQEICDDSTGYSYYWNMHTNEVTWDCPEEYTNYVLSLNSADKEQNHHSDVPKETNVDSKKSKRKKESPQLPEGAIIPISYYGNSSSEGESDSERELAPLTKKKKVEKLVGSKKSKSMKKQSAKSNMIEEESKTEIIGPQLPPDFQFPLSASVEGKETEKRVEMGPFLPPYFPVEMLKSNLEDISVKQSISETSADIFVKDIEVNSHLIEQPSEKSLDSAIKKEDSVAIQGYRPVVDYDSFTDEEEDTSKVASSNRIEATVTKSIELKFEVEDKDFTITTSQQTSNSEAEIFTKSTKRKTLNEPKLKAYELTSQSDGKYLKTSVDIDSLFAAHSSYGKYGFGFGFHEQQDLEEEEVVASRQDYKSRKGQIEKKTVSFVKSDLVLNLGSLNDVSESDTECPMVLDKQNEKSTNVEKTELKASDENEEAKEDIVSEKSSSSSDEDESSSVKSPKTVQSEECKDIVINGGNESIEESIKPSTENSVLPERSDSPDTSSFELTDDLDEIDKALCEALYKKKAQSNLKSSSVSIQASTEVLQKDLEPQVKEPIVERRNSATSTSESKDDTEFKTRIVEMASILIDKLTFLLSNSSATLPSLNSLFVQLQTRFVDWQANALDSHYFEARVKEVNDYLLHYETGVVSGDWTCQWDRVNKRYYYLNHRTQFSQWTFPEELCALEETPPITSKMDSADAVMADQDSFSTIPSSSVDFRGAPSPPPPPPGVDSPPPPLPPQSPPPSTPPPPPDRAKTEMEPEDMDLENSNDSTSLGDYLVNTNPTSPTIQSPEHSFIPTQNKNVLSPLFPSSEKRNLFPILSHDSHAQELPPVSSLEVSTTSNVPMETSDESRMGVSGSAGSEVLTTEIQSAKQSKASKSASVPVKRKKTKIQPGLGLKKKNIPSLVEKWQKIKKEQEREDKSNDSKLPITF